jgi:hypothetical protein
MAQQAQQLATGRTIGVRFPAGEVNFSLRHRFQTGSGNLSLVKRSGYFTLPFKDIFSSSVFIDLAM